MLLLAQGRNTHMNSDVVQIVIGVISLVGMIFSITLAIVQTLRLRNANKVHITNLHLLWANLKKLSHALLIDNEEQQPRKSCGIWSQRMEEIIASLIVSSSHVDSTTVERWKDEGRIDNYDYELLKRLTLN